jgi:hypothetical protein
MEGHYRFTVKEWSESHAAASWVRRTLPPVFVLLSSRPLAAAKPVHDPFAMLPFPPTVLTKRSRRAQVVQSGHGHEFERAAQRSAGPSRHTRTASGGAPSLANASLATTPTPVARMWPTKVERVHGCGNETHRWNPTGSARYAPGGRIAAASRCRSIDSLRTAASSAIRDPSGCERHRHRRCHDGRGPHCRCKQPAGAHVRHGHIGDAQPCTQALGQACHVPGQFRREHRERRRSFDRQESIGIVLDDRHTEAARNRRNRDPARTFRIGGFVPGSVVSNCNISSNSQLPASRIARRSLARDHCRTRRKSRTG